LGISLPDGYGMHWVDGTKNIHNLDETGKYQLLFTATYFSECYRLLYCHEVNSIICRHTYNTTLWSRNKIPVINKSTSIDAASSKYKNTILNNNKKRSCCCYSRSYYDRCTLL